VTQSSRPDVAAFLADSRTRVDRHLDAVLPPESEPPRQLHAAMRYAVFSGGKRLRPALAFGSALACGGALERVLPVAAAVELIHAYSLVHDDLPAMDDDAERRGRPTVHVRYGEATAILVGDALQAAAFDCLAAGGAPPAIVGRLAQAAGSRGLVGGQEDDLTYDSKQAKVEQLTSIHERKTAALFRFAAWGAGSLLGAREPELRALDGFARHYGLAFQIVDDLRDADENECSMLRILSPTEAVACVAEHVEAALAALRGFGGRAALLRTLAESVPGRLT
jgi:geranylgeranyl pyrophosphate synthase